MVLIVISLESFQKIQEVLNFQKANHSPQTPKILQGKDLKWNGNSRYKKFPKIFVYLARLPSFQNSRKILFYLSLEI